MNPDERERLLDELLQLRFGCHPDPDALRERLERDPELRALESEMNALSNTLERAAKTETPALRLSTRGGAPRSSWRRVAARAATVLLTAGLVAPLLAAGFFHWRAQHLRDTALPIRVTGPRSLLAFQPASYAIAVPTRPASEGEVVVEGRVLDADGRELFSARARGEGNMRTFDVPALAAAAAKLELVAMTRDASERVTWNLTSNAAAPIVALMTSQPAYRPGETIRLRAALLDRLTLDPRADDVRILLRDPIDATVHHWREPPTNGVVVGQYELAAGAPGGTWSISAENADGVQLARVEFPVARYQATQLFTTIALDRATYAPGQKGTATITVARAGGGAAAGAKLDWALFVDGNEATTASATLDGAGKAKVAFAVPKAVNLGDGMLVARVSHQGAIETKAESFAIPIGRLDVRFFPEGGSLVARLENRVYAEVALPNGRPASATGRVVDAGGARVAAFNADATGRARFVFTPKSDAAYRVVFDEPKAKDVALPRASGDGVVLAAASDSFGPGEPIRVHVGASREQPFTVALFCRGVLVAHEDVAASRGADVALAPSDTINGVLRVTVFDAQRVAVAERLVHRRPASRVHVAIGPERSLLAPGDRQSLRVTTTDETGRPVPAVLGLTVFDHALADLAGRPRQDLFHQTWLFADADDAEHVGALAWNGDDDANALHEIDLLLGTRVATRSIDAAVAADPKLAALARADAMKEGRAPTTRVEDTSVEHDRAQDDARHLAKVWTDISILAAGVLALVGVISLFRMLVHSMMSAQASLAWRIVSEVCACVAPIALLFFALQWVVVPRFSDSGTVLEFKAGRPPRDALIQQGYLGAEREAGDARAPGAKPRSVVTGAHADDRVFPPRLAASDPNPPPANARAPVAAAIAELREYAHAHRASNVRQDFASLLAWNAALVTDADGNATITFDTSDRLTTWDAIADAFGAGRVGSGVASFATGRTLSIEPVLPIELTQGDSVRIPLAIKSDDPAVASARVRVTLGDAVARDDDDGVDHGDGPRDEVALVDGGGRMYVPLTVADDAQRECLFALDVSGGAYADRVEHHLTIAPRGFPFERAVSGRTGFTREKSLELPAGFVADRGAASVTLFTSPLAELQGSLEGMLREPYGCFEQTSSVNYPNVLALHLLSDVAPTSGDDIAIERAKTLLASGYDRLKTFEVQGGGFEWFGHSPAHEALTAYGLLEFHDMAKVFAVDPALIARTRDWLVSRRDGKGGFARAKGALDTFGGSSTEVTSAYVTYALAATGSADTLAREIDARAKRATTTDDAYELALSACAFAAAKRDDDARAARARLVAMQADDGSFAGKSPSITGSRGKDLDVETTAFALLALGPDATYGEPAAKAFDALLERRRADGSFGATQATVMALKALLDAHERRVATQRAGRVELFLDGNFAGFADVSAGDTNPVRIEGFVDRLHAGAQQVVVRAGDGVDLPFTLGVEGRIDQPDDADDAPLTITTTLSKAEVDEGSTVRLEARVRRVPKDDLGMCIAVVGLPGGLELSARELERLAQSKDVDFAELRGRDLALYWRSFTGKAEKIIHVDLIARIPGKTTGPASRAAPYYERDRRSFAAPLAITVTESKR